MKRVGGDSQRSSRQPFVITACRVDSRGRRVCSSDGSGWLPQRALATVYLGDQSVRALMIAGAVDELEPGAVAKADVTFATPVHPWNATGL